MNWILYLLFLFGIYFIPQLIPDSALNKWELHFKAIKKKYFFRPQYILGRDLLFSLSKWEAHFTTAKMSHLKLPQYKFYTDLLLNLQKDSLKFGINLKQNLKSIKPLLIFDQSFEEKIFSEKAGGILQFFLVSFITWAFIYCANQLITVPISFTIFIFIFLLQIFGVISFLVLSFWFQKKLFTPYGEAISELIIFNSQLELGRPLNQVIEASNIQLGTFQKDRLFSDHYQFFMEAINRLKYSGISPKEDCAMIMQSLFDSQNEKLIKFKQGLSLFKFLHLAFFYLPAYFLYLASIYKFFMEQ